MQTSNPIVLGGQLVSGFRVPELLRRPMRMLAGALVACLLALAVAALATWNVSDPSLSYATGKAPTNILGYPGAVFADLMMQFLGLTAIVSLLPLVMWSLYFVRNWSIDRIPQRLLAWFCGSLLAAGFFACMPSPGGWPLPTGLGGVFGDMVLNLPAFFLGDYPSGILAAVLAVALFFPAIWLLLYGALLVSRPLAVDRPRPARRDADVDERDDDDEDDSGSALFRAASHILGGSTHLFLLLRAQYRRISGRATEPWNSNPDAPYDFNEDDFIRLNNDERIDPEFSMFDDESSFDDAPAPARADQWRAANDPGQPGGGARRERPEYSDGDYDPVSDWAPQTAPARKASDGPSLVSQMKRPKQGNRVNKEAQASLIKSGGFQLPPLHLLAEPKSVAKDPSLSQDALEQNARMLEGVLEDFGVRGEIIQVRPGPVVTLYELEPAPGIKSSRVIGLADDIARSMSAIAARVAVVPGRNAIGIELPNQGRETVYLQELLSSRDFENSKAKLALSLGKTIGGEGVIADLAKMPHLLVAGTTGSGKSVAINTMILSIVYRLPPEKCRLIMIDPKMLELSVYDGIPHLLTPVVTDPKKAVVALKWTVREMEDRYKKMSKIGVRNIDGFNNRVEQALKKGEAITRTVQTGFDRDTGEAVYETEEFELSPMPYIVVIIDEMADLMMVAGKDIEGAVQRLAQMARAAGIHVIMATQRPSVDVITGTIKANFPTRISFQVTSKIDSRTILGEMGAEQLLGMGDMLYMAGGGRIQRVHGPFVSDNEVEDIVGFLKSQGVPEYLDAITEDDDEDGGEGGSGGVGNMEDSDDPYDQAVAVVLRDGKASTSYIQRRLGIGYNRAASLIERMEDEGVIGPANHAGKREILVPTEEDKM